MIIQELIAKPRQLEIRDPAILAGMTARSSLPAFDPGDLIRHAPDTHWIILDGRGLITGRCSLWWTQDLHYEGRKVGLIGHYAVHDTESGNQLLSIACKQLSIRGCALAVGPMDGNTWRDYRFVSSGSNDPPFFLEPVNPPEWPRQFIEHGFKPLANYYSSLDDELDVQDDLQARRAAQSMENLGVRLRPLDPVRYKDELKSIYDVVATSFVNGFLYQPMEETEFMMQYERLRPYVRPELVTMAMHEDRLVGFIFTLPDLLETKSGRPNQTAIIKTLAVLPDRRFAGLGTHLGITNRRAAYALGYRRMIHALMHESNKSLSISSRYAPKQFRRYSLFAKAL